MPTDKHTLQADFGLQGMVNSVLADHPEITFIQLHRDNLQAIMHDVAAAWEWKDWHDHELMKMPRPTTWDGTPLFPDEDPPTSGCATSGGTPTS